VDAVSAFIQFYCGLCWAICVQLKSLCSLFGLLCSKKLKPAAIRPQVNELSVGNYYYVTFIYFLFLIITNTYCGLLDYGRSYAHLFYSFYLEIRSVKCSPWSVCLSHNGPYDIMDRTGCTLCINCDLLTHLAIFLPYFFFLWSMISVYRRLISLRFIHFFNVTIWMISKKSFVLIQIILYKSYTFKCFTSILLKSDQIFLQNLQNSF